MLKLPNSMLAGASDRRTMTGHYKPCFNKRSQVFAASTLGPRSYRSRAHTTSHNSAFRAKDFTSAAA